MRTGISFTVSPTDRARLSTLVRDRNAPQKHVWRAEIVLLSAEGRVHSLFRQGCLLYDLIPNMPEERLRPLVERYAQLICQNATFTGAFGIT